MKRLSLAAAAVGLVAALATGCQRPEEAGALAAINVDRAATGARPLTVHGALTTKAQSWAAHLAAVSGGRCSLAALSHSDLRAGAPPSWRMLGENVGCRTAPGSLQSFVAPLQASFMASPEHRANITNRTYNAAGVGLATAPAAGAPGWIVVYEAQEFAAL